MPHTDEQEGILALAQSTATNIMISAYAGCGKSSTLLATERVVDHQPILYLVFNLDNALKIMSHEQMQAEKRKPLPHHSDDPADRCQPTTVVRTFNSIGHRIWQASQGQQLTLDSKKTYKIFREMAEATKGANRDDMWAVYREVTQGVALAKALGYVPEGYFPTAKRLITTNLFHASLEETPDDFTGSLIDRILLTSIRLGYKGTIDYNDQVYLPALFGGTFPKYPLVLVDEYQDLSPVNHALLQRLVKGRLIGVGDPCQNIYGFRGASAGGMADATEHYACQSRDLSISFRCPSEIVRNVQWRVPHFRWLNTGGSVERPTRFRIEDFDDQATIICRNNAPLFGLGMQLLGHGRAISMAGSDVGPKLIGIMQKLGPSAMERTGFLALIDEWLEAKLAKNSKTAEDMAECMRVFAGHGKTLGEAINYAEYLFKQTGKLHLTTGHKAKGLEWDTVYYLDPWLTRKNANDEQNQNLDYVISTRTRDRLVEIDSTAIET
jgi:superfamily I DNA/RNA helicase